MKTALLVQLCTDAFQAHPGKLCTPGSPTCHFPWNFWISQSLLQIRLSLSHVSVQAAFRAGTKEGETAWAQYSFLAFSSVF